MEPENPDDRPESPKKKIRPSSTTNSEVSHSDSQSATGSVGTSGLHSEMNGGGLAAPRRDGRLAEASSSSEMNNSNGPARNILPSVSAASAATPQKAASIQEEVVSSSENTVRAIKPLPIYREGDADSLTNEAEPTSNERLVLSRANEQAHGSEAERKEL